MTAAVADGITWRVHAVIEKFSPEQSRYAERRWLAAGPALWGQWALPRPASVLHWSAFTPDAFAPRIHGDYMRRLCGAPELGVREEAGNLLVTQGLDQITKLLIGASATTIANTHGICGVGTGTTAAAVGDTALTNDNSANAFYQGFDSTYPQQSNGVMTGQSTFASANANFAWNEWCWAASTGTYGGSENSTQLHKTSGSGLWTTATTQYLWNHKVPASSLGTKASGASWVFTTTITLS